MAQSLHNQLVLLIESFQKAAKGNKQEVTVKSNLSKVKHEL